jgi:hypothetical protein
MQLALEHGGAPGREDNHARHATYLEIIRIVCAHQRVRGAAAYPTAGLIRVNHYETRRPCRSR